VCGVVAGLLARAGLPMPLAAAPPLLAGAPPGAVNGALVARLGLPSIVVTLATFVIWRESLRWAREGEFVRDLPPDFQWFGLPQTAGQWLVVGVALGVFVVFAWGLRNLAAGRAVYATGSDEEAARLAGLRPRAGTFGGFVLTGALAGLAAVVGAGQVAFVGPEGGTGGGMEGSGAAVGGGAGGSAARGSRAGAPRSSARCSASCCWGRSARRSCSCTSKRSGRRRSRGASSCWPSRRTRPPGGAADMPTPPAGSGVRASQPGVLLLVLL